ncbi:PREDICTED: complement C3-like [Acropora digitifera]|uniref:complement C3-like n=1 Tax=Acropora digitifera TaxID=70779 RepID=UPI00077A069D|nr:PREDICTED: complement C3-like [Acropora digitifera]
MKGGNIFLPVKIDLVIQNPQGIRVQQWKDLDTSTGIISKRLNLGDYILMGNWTITAVYGHQDLHNTSAQFEVKEYVLPRFSVKISAPQYILPITGEFSVNITARYRYMKSVLTIFVRSLITRRKISSTSNTYRSRTRVDQGRVYFHTAKCLPGDAMHDVLERVLQYQCKELMKAIIQDEKLMSLDVLNQHLKKFDYGNYNNKNKSSHITLQTLNSENNSLGHKARSGCSLVSTTMQMKIHLSQDSRFRETSLLTITLMVLFIQLHENGFATIKANTLALRRMKGGSLWFPEKSRLLVDVELTETATGEKRMAVDSSCQFTSSPYMIEFKNTAKYFKPGLRFVVKVVVTYPNKNPAENIPLIISAQGRQDGALNDLKKFRDRNSQDKTDELGEAEFVVDACSGCDAILIQVRTQDDNLNDEQNAVANYIVKPFNAENGPLLMLRQLSPGKVGKKIQCESYRSINEAAAKLSFAVVSRGRILSHSTTDSFDGIFKSWSFLVSPQMSPSARLIGYYIDNNERVVADSILLNIEDSLPSEVKFPAATERLSDGSTAQTNEVKKQPGEHYTLEVMAPAGTRIGLLAVDQSVYLLRNDNRLTKDRIFKTAEEFDLGCGVGGGKDSQDIFKNAGVVLMTNDFVSDEREDYGCDATNSRRKRSTDDKLDDKDLTMCCDLGKSINASETCGTQLLRSNRGLLKACRREAYKCCTEKHGLKGTAFLGRVAGDVEDALGDKAILDQTQVRSYFPETWIYTEETANSAGLVSLDVTIPGTITTWVMQAVAINNKTGLGLATPLRIVGFREIFISLKLPYSVKRGEQFSVLITVYNYNVMEMRAKLYIKGDKDHCSIAAKGQSAFIGFVDLQPNEAKSVVAPIVPKRTGEIPIQVDAVFQIKFNGNFLNTFGDSVKRKLLVVPEGKEQRKSQSFILDPSGYLKGGKESGENETSESTQPAFESQSKLSVDLIILFINSRNIRTGSVVLKLPNRTIPGSVGAVVYLTGNLLGPVINSTIEGGLEKFFRMPTGCGEQNMIYLAPNVYVLEYLTNTGQLTGAQEQNAYRFIQAGYARELNYRRSDMAFSAWGNTTPGSTWLTAFVMRVFCKAQEFAGVNIDENLVCQSVAWLIQNQRTDGALPEVNHVYHREMVGGVYTEGDAAMTAFVLSALAECKCKGANSEAAILRGKSYLENQYRTLNKPYSMALTAYALSLIKSEERFKANDRLIQRAIYDKDKETRYWNAGQNALNVETAGYAMMTQLLLHRTGYAGPIVTYLTNQRKGGMGFVSTQDTVVALQALAMYSEKTQGNALDLRVKMTSELDPDWKPPEIHITQENALLRRQIDVTRYLGGELFVETRGTGVGLLQVEARYNLPSARGEQCKFSISTNVTEIKDDSEGLFGPVQNEMSDEEEGEKKKKKNEKGSGGKRKRRCKGRRKRKRCRKNPKTPKPTRRPTPAKKPQKHQPVKSISLRVCTQYNGRDNRGMSIMDIGILSGFKPAQESLTKLQDTVAEVDKVEVSQVSVVVYLSEIPSDRQLCVDVRLDREFYVGVVQAVPIKVYDYYEPEEYCNVFYGPNIHSPLNLGVCDEGLPSCKCTQDVCAQQDPPIGDPDKLMRQACEQYHYVIKGRVLLIDEDDKSLTYVVRVTNIIQQGNKALKIGDDIEFWKSGTCQSPDLKENKNYLFMGRDDGHRYTLDNKAFVKLWPTKEGNTDKSILDSFETNYTC